MAFLFNQPTPQAGEVLVLKISQAQKKTVIERDTDLLTKQELRIHKDAVKMAMLRELKTWAGLKCFSRKLRRHAKNIVDSRWVYKWKWEGEGDERKRTIRARLTCRGFKDKEAPLLETYAGTAQRASQRILCSISAIKKWPLVACDITKAFLQGLTYEEMSACTGEPVREVNLEISADAAEIIRQVPGFESFNELQEVLHNDKPGTGLVDAPRAFSLKVAQVLQKLGLRPTTVDPEVWTWHENEQLVAVLTKHVDDLKMTGQNGRLKRIIDALENVFGKMTQHWNEFTNCGMRHRRNGDTNVVTVDQIEYIAALKPIVHPQIGKQNAEQECCTALHDLFRSLLGAAAFATLTRADVCVFIVALQKAAHKSKVKHVKALNRLVRWMQKHPQALVYRPMDGPLCLQTHSDSAFKKEETTGHALKGTVVMLTSINSSGRTAVAHLLDFSSKRVRHVTRSTFSAELFAACDSVDTTLLLAQLLHEIWTPQRAIGEARRLRESGGYAIPIVLCIDAMSIWSAVAAIHVRTPAEKSLLGHLQFLKELLTRRAVHTLRWVDTRMMHADGLTKGAIARDDLHRIMKGTLQYAHELKDYTPATATSSAQGEGLSSLSEA